MSTLQKDLVLYYHTGCENCKKLLSYVSDKSIQERIFFIPIDRRVIDDKTGNFYIIMESGKYLPFPNDIERVPAMVLINDNGKVLIGDKIYSYINPLILQSVKETTKNEMEPSCYSFTGMSTGSALGVVSDNLSFLDMDANELSTKGKGGLRQMHDYVGLQEQQQQHFQEDDYAIPTPTDDFDYRVGANEQSMTVEQLMQKREEELRQTIR